MWEGHHQPLLALEMEGPSDPGGPRRWQSTKWVGAALEASERSAARGGQLGLASDFSSASPGTSLPPFPSHLSIGRVLRVALTSVLYVDFEFFTLSDNIGFWLERSEQLL